MKKETSLRTLLLIFSLAFSMEAFSSNLEKVYLKELKQIEKIEKRGNNKLFSLMRNSSKELSKNWSPELANELASVFNKLLDVNQNYFLVGILDPVLKEKKAQFLPILNKNLSPKNQKLYQKLRKMADREASEGNG